MALDSHLTELSEKHKKLERDIADALRHPSVDDAVIVALKRQKLRLKEEIERLRLTAH